MPRTALLLVTAALLHSACAAAWAQPAPLQSGAAQLAIGKDPSGAMRVALRLAEAPAGAATDAALLSPIRIYTTDGGQKLASVAATYSKIEAVQGGWTCTATVTSAAGSVFDVKDTITPFDQTGTFLVARAVAVRKAAPQDAGYRTEFALQSASPAKLADMEMFAPGIVYCDQTHMPSDAVTVDPKASQYILREDRFPLPLVMIRTKENGVTLTLTHQTPAGETFVGDFTGDTVIDTRVKVASLGFRNDSPAALVLDYPCYEGEHSYLKHRRQSGSAADRYYPVTAQATQQYSMLINAARRANYDDAMMQSWRLAYDAAKIPIIKVPINTVYSDTIALLDFYGKETNGAWGFPFHVQVPGGEVLHTSYQMGFVGEQIPCGYYLVDAGLTQKNAGLQSKGEKILDFWAKESLSPQGVPRVWFDPEPRPHWRNYETFLRTTTDGMEGMLQGWNVMRQHGQSRPQWLDFCRKVGDWLLKVQKPDGSFARSYSPEGKVIKESTTNSLHPVRFLLDLSLATGDSKYLDAAKRAATFGLASIGNAATYVGGTDDHPDIKDKEAGWIAFDSFLALYDVTHEKKWLDAASAAATFTETWIYGWNVPIPADDLNADVPKICKTYGLSIIAIGHSGGDMFMSIGASAYYRLYLYTGDAHFADVARLLLYDSKQTMDIAGSLHFARPALQTEAMSMAAPRGHSVKAWLPWESNSNLEPLVQLRNTFGSMDLLQIDALPLAQRQAKLQSWWKTRGFAAK